MAMVEGYREEDMKREERETEKEIQREVEGVNASGRSPHDTSH